MRVGISAGEASGDALGAELMRGLAARVDRIEVRGIAGRAMQTAGCDPLADSGALSVMGLTEVLGALPRLLRLRRDVERRLRAWKPDVFVGIDAPDFNIGLERRLHDHGIRTVHYVSPSVWAWRSERVKVLARAVDRVLTLFPFEKAFYDRQGVPARFVGHPLVDRIAWNPDPEPRRRRLGLPLDRRVMALLPGSRATEYRRLAEPFIDAARRLAQRDRWHFVLPLVDADARAEVQRLVPRDTADAFSLVDGQALDCIAAADVVLTASGTATLETMLVGRPMVVAYRLAPVTYQIARRLVRTPYFALPNLLAGELLVPELLQHAATPTALAQAVEDWFRDPRAVPAGMARFERLRSQLAGDITAAEAVLEVL